MQRLPMARDSEPRLRRLQVQIRRSERSREAASKLAAAGQRRHRIATRPRQLQAQTLQLVCPVSEGEFNSAAAGDLDAEMPGGSPALEDVLDVVPDDPVGPELAF